MLRHAGWLAIYVLHLVGTVLLLVLPVLMLAVSIYAAIWVNRLSHWLFELWPLNLWWVQLLIVILALLLVPMLVYWMVVRPSEITTKEQPTDQ